MSDKRVRTLWVVHDPYDRPVCLTERRQEHIITGHPEVEPYIDRLADSVEEPHMIVNDPVDFDTEVFCKYSVGKGSLDSKLLQVIVRYDISDSGQIITAYFTTDIPRGDIKWLPKRLKK